MTEDGNEMMFQVSVEIRKLSKITWELMNSEPYFGIMQLTDN